MFVVGPQWCQSTICLPQMRYDGAREPIYRHDSVIWILGSQKFLVQMIKWKQESGNEISQPEIPRNSRNPKPLNGSGLRNIRSKDTQFATVKLPKCLEGPHNTYDRSTNSSRMQHRSRSNSMDGHSSTHDTCEGSSQKRIHVASINGTLPPGS